MYLKFKINGNLVIVIHKALLLLTDRQFPKYCQKVLPNPSFVFSRVLVWDTDSRLDFCDSHH